jgi:TonB-linked SusC/RagA family outer membrane protein
MKKLAYLLLLFGCLLPNLLFAQQTRTVSGTVTDNSGLTLPGVSVVVKGTMQGTVTDIDGNYSLETGEDAMVLVFSFIGMQTVEEVIDGRSVINVQLSTDMVGLEEVVFIGYGTVKRKDLTGSIETLQGNDLVKSLNVDMTEALNGRISGVLVSKSSNRPGSPMSIEIRGRNSINFSNEPLYVIDGIPSYSGMRNLNPADIESIDVLKDASSSAIYGSRGANGVVIITTKGANARTGLNVEYSASVGRKYPVRIPDMIGNMGNGDEYLNYRIDLWKKKYGDASLARTDFLTDAEKLRIKNGEYYDWLREVSSPAMVSNHNVTSSGGNDNTSYSFGLGYANDGGMVGPERFQRITANARLVHRFSEYLQTGVTTYLSNNYTNQGARDALVNAYFIPPIVSPYDENFEQAFIVQPTSSKINPIIQMENNIRESRGFYSNFSGFLEFKPFSFLSFKSLAAYQFDTDISGEWVGVYTQQKSGVNPNEAFRSEGRNDNLVWDNIVTLDKNINNIHQINVIGLFSMQQDTHKGSGMSGEDLPYDSYWHAIQTATDVRNVSSYYWESSMISYMLRANYVLNDKYMFTVTGRYDGSSRLQQENRWGFMPSVALGWQLKNESFLQDVDAISNMRIRLSYGKSGNNNIGHDVTLTRLNLSRYTFGDQTINGFTLGNQMGNKNLRWEMTSEYNLGLDFGFFNSRITGTVDAYVRTTEDLIMQRSISTVNGFSSVLENIGTTENRGIELGLNTVNISSSDFWWRTNFTFSLNRNQIIDLYGDQMDDLGNRWFIGQPINVIYDLEQLGIWQEEEAEEAGSYGQSVGHIKVRDRNGDFSIDEKDYVILGTPTPDWTAGVINSVYYKNFDLMVDVYARVGGLYNDGFQFMFTAWDNEHWNKLDVEYWTPENRSNKYQEVGAVSYHTQVLGNIPGTFVKVRNITLGYTLAENVSKSIRLNEARVYLAVQNPFTFTEYLGPDPEIIGENVYSQLSLYPMTFTAGINVKF